MFDSVRGRSEWEEGHIAGVANIPVGFLPDRLAELPRGKSLVMQCQSGSRSSIASSILLARGFTDVVNLTGGFEAWERAGLPVEVPAPR